MSDARYEDTRQQDARQQDARHDDARQDMRDSHTVEARVTKSGYIAVNRHTEGMQP